MLRLREFAMPLLMCMIVIVLALTPVQRYPERPAGEHQTIEQELEIFAPVSLPGVVGSPAQDLRHQFAGKYNATRREKLACQTSCEACGLSVEALARRGAHLETHHCISVERIYAENLDESLIWDADNLIVLCRGGTSAECHFNIGHDPDGPSGPKKPSWTVSNKDVRKDAKRALAGGK